MSECKEEKGGGGGGGGGATKGSFIQLKMLICKLLACWLCLISGMVSNSFDTSQMKG